MRRTLLAIVSTVTGLVMLLSFKTYATTASAVATAAPPSAVSSPSPSAASSRTGSSGTASPTTGATSGATSVAVARTVTGDAVDTRWGPVQVQITVANGKITAAQAVVYPQNNPRDQEINARAVPILNGETATAGSAGIDMVSGATYTSTGYIASLQSALDKVKS